MPAHDSKYRLQIKIQSGVVKLYTNGECLTLRIRTPTTTACNKIKPTECLNLECGGKRSATPLWIGPVGRPRVQLHYSSLSQVDTRTGGLSKAVSRFAFHRTPNYCLVPA